MLKRTEKRILKELCGSGEWRVASGETRTARNRVSELKRPGFDEQSRSILHLKRDLPKRFTANGRKSRVNGVMVQRTGRQKVGSGHRAQARVPATAGRPVLPRRQ